MKLRDRLLEWITQDAATLLSEGRSEGVPIHLLFLKAALERKGEGASSSESTEISLQLFERAAICRALRDLVKEGVITFTDKAGNPIAIEEREIAAFSSGEPSQLKYILPSNSRAAK